MKKKIFALMMALVMALPLAACGDEPGTPDNNTAADDGSWAADVQSHGLLCVRSWNPCLLASERYKFSSFYVIRFLDFRSLRDCRGNIFFN